jgi:hypothetical protein
LEWFKSMSDKRALLDAAIQTYDGNCIMAVLIFMRKTVNQSRWTIGQNCRAISDCGYNYIKCLTIFISPF